jgi:hypothetical protein
MLPRVRRWTWVKIRYRMRVGETRQLERLHLRLSPEGFRYPPQSLRGRVWRVLDLLAQMHAGILSARTQRELEEQLAEVDPLVDRLIAGQNRWGTSRH